MGVSRWNLTNGFRRLKSAATRSRIMTQSRRKERLPGVNNIEKDPEGEVKRFIGYSLRMSLTQSRIALY